VTEHAGHKRLAAFRVRDERGGDISPFGSLLDNFFIDEAVAEAVRDRPADGLACGACRMRDADRVNRFTILRLAVGGAKPGSADSKGARRGKGLAFTRYSLGV
jgi:hypothetical protein